MAQSVIILGATGSIGRQALDIIAQSPDSFILDTLVAHTNVEALALLALQYRPLRVIIADSFFYKDLCVRLEGSGILVAAGADAIGACVQQPKQLVVAAMVGIAGLPYVYQALSAGQTVALANKESLVCAGHLLSVLTMAGRGRIIPVDSEHSALAQVLHTDAVDTISKVIITASGGPFYHRPLDTFDSITVEQALNHPNWHMGAKISIDSATMMNKGLEVIEAFHLFPITPQQLQVVIHPQSLVHGAVLYHDGSILAHAGYPDMRIPIAWALHYPARVALNGKMPSVLDFTTLNFYPPDDVKFPLLPLAVSTITMGAYASIALNAANEVAVAAFLARGLSFRKIAVIVAKTLEKVDTISITTLDDVLAMDALSRVIAQEVIDHQ